MKENSVTDEKSFKKLKKYLNDFDQELAQPIIDQIIANFANDLNHLKSEEYWEILKRPYSHFTSKRLKIIEELIKYGHTKLKDHTNMIKNFLLKINYDLESLHKYRKILLEYTIKTTTLIECEKNEDELKPIHFIFAFVHEAATIKELIAKYDLNINDKTKSGLLPIHFAAKLSNKQGLNILLDDKQVFINVQDAQLNTPLHLAISSEQPDIVAKLIEDNRIDLSIKNFNKETPLCFAAKEGDVNSFKMLLRHRQNSQNFKIDDIDTQGATLLNYAAFGGNEPVVRLLVEEYNANINSPENGSIALRFALRGLHRFIVKYLIEHGSDIVYVFNGCRDAEELCRIANKLGHGEFLDKPGTIFSNKLKIVTIMDKWHLFDRSAKKDYLADFPLGAINTLKVNEIKLAHWHKTAETISKFFYNREQSLNKLSQHSGKVNDKKTSLMCDFNQLEYNIFHKAVIHKMMNGEILLYDENHPISSNDIINEVKLSVKIFLFHKSKFITDSLSNDSRTELLFNDESYYGCIFAYVNLKNYDAITQWKNEHFFEIIFLKKKGRELTVYTKQTDHKTSEEETDQQATMVWGSDHLLYIIASFCDVEQYYKSLKVNKTENSSGNNTETINQYNNGNSLIGESNHEADLT